MSQLGGISRQLPARRARKTVADSQYLQVQQKARAKRILQLGTCTIVQDIEKVPMEDRLHS
ncbi:hypothetical protein DPMN_111778 [Dreissena polymorpha]|uniref:Uncharacterized protein n=1 Tax=Dreissena polymorpha TaxID=45954 RepID=A0A9D4KFA8_DREPO|nr:hypothetical protein DPMN_111778 [Dreissena polymorpha]